MIAKILREQKGGNLLVARQIRPLPLARCFSATRVPITTPVVIVGGGPSGLLLSNLLSSYGTPSVLLEAQTPEERFRHPQAHFLNTRTMEILRHSVPNIYREVKEKMPPVHQWNHFQLGPSMSHAVARVHHPVDSPLQANTDGNGKLVSHAGDLEEEPRKGCIDSNPPLSICPVAHLAQHHFCRILWEAAKQGATAKTRLDYGAEVIQVLEDDLDPDYPVLVTTAQGHSFHTRLVVAADGFHSSLRKAWKIGLRGESDIQSLVNVHIKISPELSRNIHSDKNSAMLHFIYNPSVVAVVVCHSVEEYVLQIPFFPPFQTLDEDFSPDKVRFMVEAALGLSESSTTEDDLSIISIGPWTMSSLIAERYVSGDHFVLAGDSAHVFPPAGGLGMNTGLQDVHNIAWRISWLSHSTCSKDQVGNALRQYELERRPVAQQNAALSVRNFNRTLQLAKACYLDHQHPSAVMAMLSSPPLSLMPLQARQTLFRSLVETAMWPLGLFLDKTSRHGQRMKQNILTILERGEGLPLLFPKYELGFGYSSNDASSSPKEEQWTNDTAGYSPTLRVGHLLPHAIVRVASPPASVVMDRYPNLGPIDKSHDDTTIHVTTTDLPAQLQEGQPCFVLLLIDCPPSAVVAIEKQLSYLGSQIHMVRVRSGEYSNDENVIHSDLVVLEDQRSTLRSMLSPIDGSPTFVLVRPDGHVAGIIVANDEETVGRTKEGDIVDCPMESVHEFVEKGMEQSLGTEIEGVFSL